jgi:hypothetical protein
MSAGDVAAYAVAFAALAFLIYAALKHWKGVAIGVGALLIVISVAAVGPTVWQQITDYEQLKSCMTAHERQAKASAAPDDYFGRQLRETASAEARRCAEFAARKEAAKVTQK